MSTWTSTRHQAETRGPRRPPILEDLLTGALLIVACAVIVFAISGAL